jgi:hypothetical protein
MATADQQVIVHRRFFPPTRVRPTNTVEQNPHPGWVFDMIEEGDEFLRLGMGTGAVANRVADRANDNAVHGAMHRLQEKRGPVNFGHYVVKPELQDDRFQNKILNTGLLIDHVEPLDQYPRTLTHYYGL